MTFEKSSGSPSQVSRGRARGRSGLQPLCSPVTSVPRPTAPGLGAALRGAGSTRRAPARGDNKSTDYEGQFSSPSCARHGLSPSLRKALCTRRELSVGPFSLERGWLWDLPGFPVRAGMRGGCGAAPSPSPRCCRWTSDKPGAGGTGFLPARRWALRKLERRILEVNELFKREEEKKGEEKEEAGAAPARALALNASSGNGVRLLPGTAAGGCASPGPGLRGRAAAAPALSWHG